MSPAISKYLLLVSLLSLTCAPLSLAVCPYEECFCTSSNGVTCTGSEFKSLPLLKTGSDVKKVNLLFIMNTEITQIPDNSLPPNLTTIYMTDNPISDISSNAFADSADTLISIVFGNAKFTKLPDALQSFTNLKSLTIQETLITDWNEPVLRHIGSSLTSLSLVNVGLTQWPEWINFFPSLTSVYISDTSITTVPDTAFIQMKNNHVIAIIISNSNLAQIPKAFLELPYLDHLSLEGNDINFLSNIPNTKFVGLARNKISNATNLAEALLSTADTLESIDVRSNNLSVLPDLSRLPNLIRVDLRENQISNHNVGSFPPSVTKLQLNANQLSSVPVAVASISNLTELDLSLNMITEISVNSFPIQLMTLDLSGNNIFKIMPGGFPAQVSTVDLSSNNITDITPGIIPELLTELDLSDNAISRIMENTFPHNSSLKTLNLAGNPIAMITRSAFQQLQELQTIDLRSTALTHIPLALTSLPNLQQLYLGDIPSLICTCPIDPELHQWFESRNIETWTSHGQYGYCNGTAMYDYKNSIRIDDYLRNKTCNKVITTPVPNTSTTDDGSNGASSLIHRIHPFFLVMIILLLNVPRFCCV